MLISDNEVRKRIEAELALNAALDDLLAHGCVVFGAVEKQRLEGAPTGSIDWHVAHYTIAHIDDPSIVWQEEDVSEDVEDTKRSTE